MTEVLFKCINESGRLRVRIVTNGYLSNANCQFPSAIRQPGRYFTCDTRDVSLVESRSKYFYRVRKGGIKIVNPSEVDVHTQIQLPEKVFDTGDLDCSICISEPKTLIFVPCGHFCSCNTCSSKIKNKCPICRSDIACMISPDEVM